jgi:hypothetical protein
VVAKASAVIAVAVAVKDIMVAKASTASVDLAAPVARPLSRVLVARLKAALPALLPPPATHNV